MSKRATYHDLEGASVFVTGGGSGIGAELVRGFLEQGAQVAFCDLNDAQGFADEVAAETGNRPMFVQADVTDIPGLHAAMDAAEAAHGPLEVLVNNAANDKRHSILEADEAFWDWSVGINFKSYFFACQRALRSMKAAGKGRIVNYSSVSFMMGQTGMAAYTGSNAGIMGMSRSLAREFGPHGIRVNSIAPGWVMTPKQKEVWVTPEALAETMERQCIPAEIEPIDMVAPTLFLASNASHMMTGQVLVVDGGVVHTG